MKNLQPSRNRSVCSEHFPNSTSSAIWLLPRNRFCSFLGDAGVVACCGYQVTGPQGSAKRQDGSDWWTLWVHLGSSGLRPLMVLSVLSYFEREVLIARSNCHFWSNLRVPESSNVEHNVPEKEAEWCRLGLLQKIILHFFRLAGKTETYCKSIFCRLIFQKHMLRSPTKKPTADNESADGSSDLEDRLTD